MYCQLRRTKICNMTFQTEIEVDGLDTQVTIDFDYIFGDVSINKITNDETGDAIDANIPDLVMDEIAEYAHNEAFNEDERRLEDAMERYYDHN